MLRVPYCFYLLRDARPSRRFKLSRQLSLLPKPQPRLSLFHLSHKLRLRLLSPIMNQALSRILNGEQVLRLNENQDFSYAEAQRDFGFSPLAFEEG